MVRPFRRIAHLIVALIVGVFSINIIGAVEVGATNGNNGTLKVHELNTPSGTESNDPKVCAFDFEGFQFDPSQDGYILIQPKNGGAPALNIPFGPADALGYDETANINDGVSGYTLANGDYKATLYGKDTGNPALPNLNDEKAKSKNFKVECQPKSVAAAPPTKVDLCGRQNDTYTIPLITGVIYKIDGNVVAAGTYPATSNVTIKAEAAAGYSISGTKEWTLSFTNTTCTISVTPAVPTKNDVCGIANDTYNIPATTGVKYFVNGVEKAAGTYSAPSILPYYIKAVALPGYAISGNDDWVVDFSSLPCPVTPAAPSSTDLCGKQNDTYTIPATTGVRYYVNGHEKAAGTYNGEGVVIIVAVAKSGFFIHPHAQALWIINLSSKKCPEPCVPTQIRTLTFFGGHHNNDPDCIPVAVAPETPTKSDVCGTADDTYTIPATTGVKYLVNGIEKAAGTYQATGLVQITAVALPQYVLANNATASWEFNFTNVACPVSDISVTAECSTFGVFVTLKNEGNADGYVLINGTKIDVAQNQTVEVTIPYVLFKADVTIYDDKQNLLLDESFDCSLGMGGISGPGVTPIPTVSKVAAVVKSETTELPTTGGFSLGLQLLIMTLLGASTYAVTYYLYNNRRIVTKNR